LIIINEKERERKSVLIFGKKNSEIFFCFLTIAKNFILLLFVILLLNAQAIIKKIFGLA